MKIHIVTVGKPKLAYAVTGWEDYLARLQRLHTVRITQLAEKYAADASKISSTTAASYVVALDIDGTILDSLELADFLTTRQLDAREVSFVIGGPDGLPQAVRESADFRWSLSRLTLPHDLAMVVTLEALFRASTIKAGLPYHR